MGMMKKILFVAIVLVMTFITIYGSQAYNYNLTPTNNDTIQIQKPSQRRFTVSPEFNNVTTNWYVNNILDKEKNNVLTFSSNKYDDYELLTVNASISDGSENHTEQWTVEILPADVQAVGGIAIVIFILTITIGLIILPFKKEFSKNAISNLFMRRACWAIGIYLMMLNSAIMATIASASGLDLIQEMFRYMWLFATLGWLFIGFTALKTLFDILEIMNEKKRKKRMGEEDG